MSFNIERFGSDASNVKSILGGVCYYRYFNKDNNDITVAGYFPASLGLQLGDRIKVIPATKTDADEEYIVSDITNRVVTVTKVEAGGAVDSVNGKTGAVVLDATDVGALPSSTQIPDAVQYATMPTASADNEGQIVQFTGTTDANYTNGYFYKCVGAGEPVTYSWEAVEVQASSGGLPDQTGQSGKFLTTDGTDASWATINALENTATGEQSLKILGSTSLPADFYVALGYYSAAWTSSVAIGYNAVGGELGTIAIGAHTEAVQSFAIVIGEGSKATAACAIQLGSTGSENSSYTNSDANTFKVGNANGNFELMDANGNLPADRLASTTGLADGNYRLRLTMASGVPTLTWVAE